MTGKLLLVSEDINSSKKIKHNLLKKAMYNIGIVSTGTEALKWVENEQPDLVIIDFLLPDLNGIEVCKEIRKTSLVPIFLISSETDAEAILSSYEAGINDHIIKPFDETILTTKIYANLKRDWKTRTEQVSPAKHFTYKNLEIDLTNYAVKVNGEAISLIAKELKILLLLTENPNMIFSAEQLYKNIWGTDSFGDARTVMVHISNLRKKIEENPSNPEYIQTIRGFGYKFNNSFSQIEINKCSTCEHFDFHKLQM